MFPSSLGWKWQSCVFFASAATLLLQCLPRTLSRELIPKNLSDFLCDLPQSPERGLHPRQCPLSRGCPSGRARGSCSFVQVRAELEARSEHGINPRGKSAWSQPVLWNWEFRVLPSWIPWGIPCPALREVSRCFSGPGPQISTFKSHPIKPIFCWVINKVTAVTTGHSELSSRQGKEERKEKLLPELLKEKMK